MFKLDCRRSLFLVAFALSSAMALAQAQRPKITLPLPAVQEFAFSRNRPRVVVLLHGVTPKYEEDRAAGPGTSLHPRYYWGPDFIQALMGYPFDPQMKVVLAASGTGLRIRTIPRNDWSEQSKLLPVNGNDLAPVIVRTPLPTENIANNSKEIELQL